MALFGFVDAGGNDSFTKLLLHLDADFTDSSASPHAITANGNAQITTAQSVFGGGSLALDGAGDYLSVPDSADWNLGAGDFAIDFRIRFNTLGAVARGLFAQDVDFANNFVTLVLDAAGNIIFSARTGGVDVARYFAAHGFSTGIWYHVAAVRSGTSFFIFKDGIAYGLTTSTAIGTNSLPDLAASLAIGADIPGGIYVDGWIDEFRWSKGTDRGWTSDFSPYGASYD